MDSHHRAIIAQSRFGLGAMPGQLATVMADPRGWLLGQLRGSEPSTDQRLAERPDHADTVRQLASGMQEGSKEARRAMLDHTKSVYRTDVATHLSASAASSRPFRERLTRFWGNHLTVSVARKEVLGIAGAFERDVVRAHLDGSFAEMVLASTRHPAMLAYLDNLKSIGPSSVAGRRRDRGLNENLARELMELHTLGVDGGYSQADVRSMAELLTGWSLATDDGVTARMTLAMGGSPAFTGAFGFQHRMHEPGTKQLLGRRYGEGEAAGVAAIEALARHPATGRNVARRLVAHFHPRPTEPSGQAAEHHLAQVFTDSEGHLPTVHEALVTTDSFWERPWARVKTPHDLVLGVARALGLIEEGEAMGEALEALGQPLWRAPSPKGWSDDEADWTGPEQVLGRIEWLARVARTVGPTAGRGRALADELYGATLSPRTADTLRSAGRDDLWVLLCSPEMQRR